MGSINPPRLYLFGCKTGVLVVLLLLLRLPSLLLMLFSAPAAKPEKAIAKLGKEGAIQDAPCERKNKINLA